MTNYELHAQLLKRHFKVAPSSSNGILYANDDLNCQVHIEKESTEAIHADCNNALVWHTRTSLDKCHVDCNGTLHLNTFTI